MISNARPPIGTGTPRARSSRRARSTSHSPDSYTSCRPCARTRDPGLGFLMFYQNSAAREPPGPVPSLADGHCCTCVEVADRFLGNASQLLRNIQDCFKELLRPSSQSDWSQSQWRTDMLMLDRRTLLRAGSAAVGAAALAPTAPALARAPQAGKQAQPSFYRFKLGTIEITVVSDGTLAFPAETLWGDGAEDARGRLASTFEPPSPVGLQLNTILVNTGDKLVLIDAGGGVDAKSQKTAGGLLGNLAAAGYAPGDIDMILFTHGHADHLWGISDGKNASLLFPSADFVASETEVAFWNAAEL